jgi:Cd(II)/Pb(II)-responsive transcriptional regulator
MNRELMKIGELAARAGTPVETIRYYEREGLLARPPRSANNYRLYDAASLARLLFIRHCRSLDLTLAEVAALLALRDAPAESCAGVNALLDRHIAQVAQRLHELTQLQSQLSELRGRCHAVHASGECEILRGLTAGLPAHSS